MAAGPRPLPKFGEWDVNQTGGDQGFTVIFNKARNNKRTSGSAVGGNIKGGTSANSHGGAMDQRPMERPPPPPQHEMNRDNPHGHGHPQGYGHGHPPGHSHFNPPPGHSHFNPPPGLGPNSQGQAGHGHGHPQPHQVPAAAYYESTPNKGQQKPSQQKNRWLCCIYGS